MASFREEYSLRDIEDKVVRHDVCKSNGESLTEVLTEYEKQVFNSLLDDLLRSHRGFSA